MSLKLKPPRPGKTPYYSVRGTYLGIYVDRSTGSSERKIADRIRQRWKSEIEQGVYLAPGTEEEPVAAPSAAGHSVTFLAAAVGYMKAGGDRKRLGPIVRHTGPASLRDLPIEQIDQLRIDNAADDLFPNATPQTKNREFYTPVAAVMHRAGIERRVNRERFPFVAIMVDCENDTILEEVPARRLNYVIPRWQTVAGSQWAHSPCTIAALPDARLLQQINLTLLEAGQKAVDPPMKAAGEAIQGGANMFAGGITWIDYEYDERTGAAIEPLFDTSRLNLNWGKDREEKIERCIAEAFFLNVINLPETTGGEKMTAYETEQRVREYIRRSLPLFEPMETEYNGALCENTWEHLMDLNAFGSFEDMPPALSRHEIIWQFESPLQAANERVKSEAFKQSAELLQVAAAMSEVPQDDFDISKALRDSLAGMARADWITPVEQASASRVQRLREEAAMKAIGAMGGAADVAGRMAGAVEGAGNAAQAVQQAGLA